MAKATADIRSLARAQTELAIRTLTGVCGSKAAPAAARVSAANALLDRGWGKPAQTHTGEDCGGPIQVIIRKITDAEESRLPLIDLTPDRGSR
jgi:xanthine/CO dehydrogenase XdhC/CoxF family maturation factor